MVAFVGEEGGNTGSFGGCIVVGEFGEWKEFGPVVLLVVAVAAEILFECLIDTFCLTVAFGMIARGEV
jgi:uncharacterized membrane protein YdcZ (DUF606 family)